MKPPPPKKTQVLPKNGALEETVAHYYSELQALGSNHWSGVLTYHFIYNKRNQLAQVLLLRGIVKNGPVSSTDFILYQGVVQLLPHAFLYCPKYMVFVPGFSI